jgi:hypothetical protein
MSTRALLRRREKLSARLPDSSLRSFTLEELCRQYWRIDQSGFAALAREISIYRCFVESFRAEDARRASGT